MKKKNNLNFLQRIILEILWILILCVAYLPHVVKYRVLAPLVKFIIYTLLHYRVSVVRENMRESFTDKSTEELRGIESRFYTVLSEIIVSTISQANVSNMPKEMSFSDEAAEVGKELVGKNWIALTSHIGLWEFNTYFAKFCNQATIAVYHTLENPISDVLFRRLRGKDFVVTVPLQETVRYVVSHADGINGKHYSLGLLADQNPPRRPNSVWYSFMGRDTLFFDGGEKIGRKFAMPLYFAYQERISAGRYLFRIDRLHDGVEPVEECEITRRYVARLEQEIHRNPEMWLWSHRRWKHKREA